MKWNENLLATAQCKAYNREKRNMIEIDFGVIQLSLEANGQIKKNDRSTEFYDCARGLRFPYGINGQNIVCTALIHSHQSSRHPHAHYTHTMFVYDDECFCTIYSIRPTPKWSVCALCTVHITKLFTYSDSLAREIFSLR